ncbi:hypothetical protein Wxf_00060 [Armadillidium vulgare]|nr:hypothetical protein Wxf_00060 [Armadillidium vulgare] [Wolbachia endosymbiont of Armadillidium vulgare]
MNSPKKMTIFAKNVNLKVEKITKSRKLKQFLRDYERFFSKVQVMERNKLA